MSIHVEKIPAVSIVYMRRVGAYGEYQPGLATLLGNDQQYLSK